MEHILVIKTAHYLITGSSPILCKYIWNKVANHATIWGARRSGLHLGIVFIIMQIWLISYVLMSDNNYTCDIRRYF